VAGALVALALAAGAAAGDALDEALDEAAFFEFLGSFGEDDGRWLDPLELERLASHAGAAAMDAAGEVNESDAATTDAAPIDEVNGDDEAVDHD
jgi:hypothetical protein